MRVKIFRDNAPLYWAAGIPAMPLKTKSKAPILNEWTAFGTHFPSIAEREHWLVSYPNSNIGLPFGEASGLCCVDVDTDDPEILEIIEEILPASPWRRVGKKGYAQVYRWQGQPNYKIRGEDGQGMICEFLGKGNQLVLPPSIHPETGEAYVANANLWEVMDKIQPLGFDVEQKLRSALGVKGYKIAHEGRSSPLVVVPAGQRDIELVRRAGYYARVVEGIDKNHQHTLAEALQHMYAWVVDFTAHAAGDDMDPEKGTAKLLEFLLKDVENGRVLPLGWDEGLTAEQLEHPTIAAMRDLNAVQSWTVAKARKWLLEQTELRPDDEDWHLAKIQELITLIARDDQLTTLHIEAIYMIIKDNFGNVISKTAFNKALREAKAGNSAAADKDHAAIAERILEIIERDGELRFAQGSFWQWNGSCFEKIDRENIHKYVRNIKDNVLCRRAADYDAVVKVVAIIAKKELMDKPVLGVNFANGFLDIDGELHEHAPRFGQTFTMPFNYAPERAGSCHKWLAFLERIWGDDPDYAEKVAALQEAFAATMFGTAWKYQRAILLHGLAGTGKSTALEVLEAMMPPAAICRVPPSEWGERFALTGMVGKALNVCGELSESKPIHGDRFKGIVVGERQATEYKGQDRFEFQPTCAHWFASNFLPISKDGSKGFLRRWLILHFSHAIQKEERITNFAEVLVAEEREAIAAWAVQGISRLERNQDYTLPASHELHINSVRRQNNDVVAWLQSNGKVYACEGEVADGQLCYDHFKWYMKESIGMSSGRVMNFERFKQALIELEHEVTSVVDAVGVTRFQVHGLKSTLPTIAHLQ